MNENTGLPAQAFPAGEYLRDELEARDWSVAEFARILGRPPQAVSEILNGHKEITPETAMEIAAATGTEAATWLRLQDTYRLWKLARSTDADRTEKITRRARLAELLPMSELRKRGLIPAGADIDAEEAAVLDFLGITDLSEPPPFSFAARRSNENDPISAPQLAWIASVHRAAATARPVTEHRGDIPTLAAELIALSRTPDSFTRLPGVFASHGIQLVYVAHFKSGKDRRWRIRRQQRRPRCRDLRPHCPDRQRRLHPAARTRPCSPRPCVVGHGTRYRCVHGNLGCNRTRSR